MNSKETISNKIMNLIYEAEKEILKIEKTRSREYLKHIVQYPKAISVANRLPYSVDEKGELRPSTGGLAIATQSLPTKWIGWPARPLDKIKPRVIKAFKDAGITPVNIPKDVFNHFYNHVSQTFWMGFHNLELPVDEKTLIKSFPYYLEANQIFADAVIEEHRKKPELPILVHDFHLLAVPGMIRSKCPDAKIGFFLHIPYLPTTSKVLPEDILKPSIHNVMKADVVAFHTRTYVDNFIGYIKTLGYSVKDDQGASVSILHPNGTNITRLKAAPIGINYNTFRNRARIPIIRENAVKIADLLENRHIFVSFGRGDPIKGFDKALDGYERFLEENPDKIDDMVFLMIVSPSRTRTKSYKDLMHSLNEKTKRINSNYRGGNIPSVVLINQGTTIPPQSIYIIPNSVNVLSSLVNGFNLVAIEIQVTSAATHMPTVLLLSKYAGAAQIYKKGLLTIDPYDSDQIAHTYKDAIDMKAYHKREMTRISDQIARKTDVNGWFQGLLDAL